MQPDLIVAGTMLSADNRAKLESFGIPVVVERGSILLTCFTIRNLGAVVGSSERAEDVIAFKTGREHSDEVILGYYDDLTSSIDLSETSAQTKWTIVIMISGPLCKKTFRGNGRFLP